MPWDPAGRFVGAAALVTGAAHGIGRACAARLAQEGACVAVADLDLPAAQHTADSLPVRGAEQQHLAVHLDVTDDASVQRAVHAAVRGLGGLDVLVNVAGGDVAHGRFEDTDDATWSRMLELNLLGVVRCCRAAVPHLRASTASPAIVTVVSVNALTGLGSEPYSAAKAGVVSLTTNLALDLGRDGIRVNAVAPGTVRTRVWDDQDGGADRLRGLYPLGRVGEVDDVAGAVAFLASADAGWVSGHVLPVEGGLLAGPARP